MIQICNWQTVDIDNLILDGHTHDDEIVLGIDGIVDSVWTVVKQRLDRDNTEPFLSMGEFGEKISERKGTALSQEILMKRRVAGGFTANTGLAIGRLGVRASLIGMYGSNEVHPAFNNLAAHCNLFSLGSPATCQILEFLDGKLMLPHLQGLLDVDWSMLVEGLGLSKLKEIFSKAKIVSIGYWSNMPTFDHLLQTLSQEILAVKPPKHLIFDFADVTKRTESELKATLQVLGSIDNSIPVVLSLNDAEAKQVYACYGESFSHYPEIVAKSAASVRKHIGISEIVVHTTTYAVAANREATTLLTQDFCEQPVRTAGAGDTFNAGYMVALMNQLPVVSRLAVANATTSFFVRNGYPPEPKQLLTELQRIAGELGS